MAAITSFLDYTPKTAGARSRTYRVQVTPTGGSTSGPNQVIRFDIPCGRGRNVFLDPTQTTLSFVVSNPSTATDILVDGSAYCFFDRLDELTSGQLVSSILDYGFCVNAVIDAQMGANDANTSGSIAYGMSDVSAANSLNSDRSGIRIVNNAPKDFNLPLALSGLLSGLCPKLLPVGTMPDFRVELTTSTAENGAVHVTTNTSTAPATNASTDVAQWALSDIKLNLFYTDVDPQVADAIYNQNGGAYRISTEFYRSFATTLSTTARSSDSILIPVRVSSLKTLLVGYRPAADQNINRAYSISNRVNPFYSATGLTSQVQFLIGSISEPQQPMRYGVSELYTMLLQSYHSLGNVQQFNRMTLTNWINNLSSGAVSVAIAPTADKIGTCLIGVNTEAFIFKTASITCGISTLTTPVFFNATYPSNTSAAHRVTAIAHFDALLTISDAGVDVRF